MPYIHFSEQEKQAANEANLVSYLKSVGESAERHGNEYWWEAPTGKVTIKSCEWFSQYERVGGGAVSFVQKFFGMSYPDAVQALLGRGAGVTIERAPREPKENEKPKKPFEVPPKNADMRRVYAYLLNERFIDRDVLNAFVKKGLIFEDAEYHNIVFVGLDEIGEPKHIQKRASSSLSDFKGNVESSDPNYSFNFVGSSDGLYVFEEPIDMIAYISLHKKDWEQHSYVALCSTADIAAIRMLKSYPNIKNVYLCLDHDRAGIEGAYRVAENIRGVGDYSLWRAMPVCKDWDEDLKLLNGKEAIPASEHPRLEHIKMRCRELLETDIYCDEYCKDIFESKGYLANKTITRLKYLLDKADISISVAEKQQHLYNMSKIAIAFCICRSSQIEKETSSAEVINGIFKGYMPHKDTKNSVNQMLDLKEYFRDIEKTFADKDTLTYSEVQGQCQGICRLATMCLQLDGAIELEAELQQKDSMKMAM